MLLTVALVSETFADLKGRLEPWKEALESNSKGLRVNVKKMNMKISSENAGKVTEEGKFHCPVCRKGLSSNSILCHPKMFRYYWKKITF